MREPARRKWQVAEVCALLVGLVFLAFGETLHFDFVNYDDPLNVYENPAVAPGLTLKGIATVFSHSHSDYWHPLTFLTHMLDCQLYGLHPWGHHMSNVLLHMLAVVLLFVVLWEMTGSVWRSEFAAALWAIHPLRVESVAWVTERKDVLSGVFFLLTISAYLRYGRARWSLGRYLAVAALFALGLMSKPTLMPLPFLLLVFDYWPLGRFEQSAQPARAESNAGPPGLRRLPVPLRLIVEKLPLLALSIGSCIEAAMGNAQGFHQLPRVPRALQLENVLVSYAAYLWQTIWPVRLAVLYPFPILGLPVWQVLLAVAALAAISLGVFALRKRDPCPLVGWLWYLGMLTPMIGFVQAGSIARADRYTYLPTIGVCLMVTWAVADLAGQWRHRRLVLGGTGAAVLCVLLVAARHQAFYWRDSITLWTHTLDCTKDNADAHTNLGNALFQEGRTEEALAHCRAALQINPACAEAHYNLGNILLKQGRPTEAIGQYNEALRINPAYANACCNLGTALFRQGQTEEAIAQMQKALELQPSNSATQNDLAWILAAGAPQASLRNGARAVQLATEANLSSGGKNPVILHTLAAAYAEAGNFSSAVQTAQTALQLAEAESNTNLANALREEMKLYEAGRRFGDVPLTGY